MLTFIPVTGVFSIILVDIFADYFFFPLIKETVFHPSPSSSCTGFGWVLLFFDDVSYVKLCLNSLHYLVGWPRCPQFLHNKSSPLYRICCLCEPMKTKGFTGLSRGSLTHNRAYRPLKAAEVQASTFRSLLILCFLPFLVFLRHKTQLGVEEA